MTLEMRGICKSFGSNDVLKHVDFSIQGGEICALLGENGAGKSTLMNILGGVLPADRGEIVIDGTPVHFRTPSDSLSAGVAFIHQESLTVWSSTWTPAPWCGSWMRPTNRLWKFHAP